MLDDGGILGYVSSASLAAIAGFLWRSWIDNRKLRIAEAQDKRMSMDELNGHLGRELERTKSEHQSCSERIDNMQREILALQRQIIALTLRYVIPLDEVPESVRSALASMADILKTEP